MVLGLRMPRNELRCPRNGHNPHVDSWRSQRKQNLVHYRSASIPHMAYVTSDAWLLWNRQGRRLYDCCAVLEYRLGNAHCVQNSYRNRRVEETSCR